jgi:hypothetical protein
MPFNGCAVRGKSKGRPKSTAKCAEPRTATDRTPVPIFDIDRCDTRGPPGTEPEVITQT